MFSYVSPFKFPSVTIWFGPFHPFPPCHWWPGSPDWVVRSPFLPVCPVHRVQDFMVQMYLLGLWGLGTEQSTLEYDEVGPAMDTSHADLQP